MPEIPDFVTIFGSAPSSTLNDQVRSYPRRLGGINFQSWCARAFARALRLAQVRDRGLSDDKRIRPPLIDSGPANSRVKLLRRAR